MARTAIKTGVKTTLSIVETPPAHRCLLLIIVPFVCYQASPPRADARSLTRIWRLVSFAIPPQNAIQHGSTDIIRVSPVHCQRLPRRPELPPTQGLERRVHLIQLQTRLQIFVSTRITFRRKNTGHRPRTGRKSRSRRDFEDL